MNGLGVLLVVILLAWALFAYFSGRNNVDSKLARSVYDDGGDALHMHDVKRRMSALYARDEELRKLCEDADARRALAHKYLAEMSEQRVKEVKNKRVVGMKKRSD